LHDKNTKILQFLSTTTSEKKLGKLKPLKDPGVIERVDFGNDYHLPQIIRSIEMMEEEQKVCERFVWKHKTSLNKFHPRSRRLTKRSPLTHRSRNTLEDTTQQSKTHSRLLSPQNHQMITQQIYKTKNSAFPIEKKPKLNKSQLKQSPIQKYITKKAAKAKQNNPDHEPIYSNEKITDTFGDAKIIHRNEEAPK